MLNEVFARRFKELEAKFMVLRFVPNASGMSGTHVSTGEWKQWATSAQSLIRAVYGESDPHRQNFDDAYRGCSGYDYDIQALKGLFLSAKEDFEGGYVFDVDLRVSGEVFGDFVALARQSLSEGHKDVAAVLACAALEDALKRFAMANGLDVGEKNMQEVVNSLKSKSLVAGAQRSLLDAMPKIRNIAMHAEWGKLSEPDVNGVIGFVEQFILSKFSPN
ncbi:MAG TPA: hypothetical protein PLE48_02455 [Thiobacillus sp.]|nr:MAG: DUF4145 domain-containing protein [Hydrogenophilales bacterium 28-61-11]OYZ58833.1 MAG: DUF4145 domain-containing protein [Hydrogenophilales bacterium 16-61-112]OZA50910.1 MAG: DUF4145 domain-containing protein [Hydrogenophilales bacterium 17-61-76]HQT30161.1 hypothetical protein [Thiobacillus sp.]HQT69268.1 hypothetical protein [Thiobacillus sp.]